MDADTWFAWQINSITMRKVHLLDSSEIFKKTVVLADNYVFFLNLS